jgi:peptide/nickel transport system ATP-binding protein
MLLDSIPGRATPQREGTQRAGRVSGELPSPLSPPSGCRFRTRCPKAAPVCAEAEPMLRAVGTDHFVACHFPDGNQIPRQVIPPQAHAG